MKVLPLLLLLALSACDDVASQNTFVHVQVTKAEGGGWHVYADAVFPVGISRQDAIRQTMAALETSIKTEVKSEKEP